MDYTPGASFKTLLMNGKQSMPGMLDKRTFIFQNSFHGWVLVVFSVMQSRWDLK